MAVDATMGLKDRILTALDFLGKPNARAFSGSP